jgi:hypothetical protein
VALTFKYETLTPVITGPNLSDATGVSRTPADAVLRTWAKTLAYGFFIGIKFDGVRGHGRVWTVNPDWIPASKPKHEPGCNRSKDRCKCVANSSTYHSQLRRIDTTKCDRFAEWITALKPGSGVTVTEVCRALTVTRHQATQLLKAAEGALLKTGTFEGGPVFRPGRGYVKQGKTWFTQDGKG